MSVLTKTIMNSSMIVTGMVDVKKLELANSGMTASITMKVVKNSMDAATISVLKMKWLSLSGLNALSLTIQQYIIAVI